MRGHLFVFCCFFFCFACEPEQTMPEEPLLTEVNISLDSADFQQIYDLKDRWERDSLLPYLSHRDPSYRAFAAAAFSDIIQPDYIDTLGRLVTDPIAEVRRAAVFSLGQSRSDRAVPYLMKTFELQDSLGIDPLVFKYALEAVGKCADSTYLPLLAGITTYQAGDTLLLEGQSLGMYEMTLRGFTDSGATDRIMNFLSDTLTPSSVRLIAAQYLASSDTGLEDYAEELKSVFALEEDPEIRMFLGQAIGATGVGAVDWIRRILRQEKDDRVRVQILRGIDPLPGHHRHQIITSLLRDRSEWVREIAADLLLQYGHASYADSYINWAFTQFSPEVTAKILAAGNRYVANARFHQMIEELIFQKINNTTDIYLKTEFVKAAGHHPETAMRLLNMTVSPSDKVLRTARTEALIMTLREGKRIPNAIRDFLIREWESGDRAAVSLISPVMADYPDVFSIVTDKEAAWKSVEEKLQLPEDVEAVIRLKQAYAKLFDEEYREDFYRQAGSYTHPVDWEEYGRWPGRPVARIQTSRGDIEIELWKEEAPGTVINFISLAESGYYEGIPFHRVVPNFVVQGGDPGGDGYGSMEYTIRTETFPGAFDASGWVGMASAGKDTESQQWFITHRPTLHLNGKYTRFGRLISGMEVLLDIKRGDLIKEIKIYNDEKDSSL